MSVFSGIFNSMKGSLLSFLLPLLLQLTGAVRDELEKWIVTWYKASGDTPAYWDDLITSFALDLIKINDSEHKPKFPDELLEALYVLYYRAKNTPNPVDDIVMGFIFKILGIPSPVEQKIK